MNSNNNNEFFYGTLILSVLACKYSRFSLLLAARDILPGGTTAPQQQKFHTGWHSSYIVLPTFVLFMNDWLKAKVHKGQM